MLLSLATGFIISVACYVFIVTLVYFLWLMNFQQRFLKAMWTKLIRRQHRYQFVSCLILWHICLNFWLEFKTLKRWNKRLFPFTCNTGFKISCLDRNDVLLLHRFRPSLCDQKFGLAMQVSSNLSSSIFQKCTKI